jgi:hypothetical protein
MDVRWQGSLALGNLQVAKSVPDVLLWPSSRAIFHEMSTAHEIEAAIRMLSPVEREKLIKNLPVLLPELDGDMAWSRIAGDPRTRPGLSALLDQVEADYKKNSAALPEIKDEDFDLHL